MRRFFVDARDLAMEELVISGTEANHIRQVLRLKPGDRICLIDGQGGACEADIVDLCAGAVRAAVVRRFAPEPRKFPFICLAQAMLKEGRMDDLVRQSTEVGIDAWIPFFSRRTVPKPEPGRLSRRLSRWQSIARESLKQCRRLESLQIHPPVFVEELMEITSGYDVKLLFWENETRPLRESLVKGPRLQGPGRVLAVVGPEGGFEDAEVAVFRDHGFQTVGLGPRILKAETAGFAAGVLMAHLFGDLG